MIGPKTEMTDAAQAGDQIKGKLLPSGLPNIQDSKRFMRQEDFDSVKDLLPQEGPLVAEVVRSSMK